MLSIYYGLLGLGIALMLPLTAIGCGIGEGLVFASALQGIARQPQAKGDIQTNMYVTFAIIEALYFFNLVWFFMLKGMMPTPEQITTLLAK